MTVLPLWLVVGLAAAAEDPLVVARRAQRSGDPGAEHAACQAVLRNPASAPGAHACTRRLAWLDDRRDADGTWTSLLLLERARRGEPVRTALETQADDATTAPRVATEAHLWLARADLDAGALEEARTRTQLLWSAVAEHPGAPQRKQIASLHALVLARSGSLDEAEAVEVHVSGQRTANPREGVTQERRIRRWTRLRHTGWALLCLGLATGIGPAWRARRERGRFQGLVPLWTIGLGLGGLAWCRDPSTAPVTLSLLGVLSLQAVFSAYALRGSTPGRPRTLLRLVLGGAALGAGILVLERHGYLLQLLG